MQIENDRAAEGSVVSEAKQDSPAEPSSNRPAKLIAELLMHPEFPKSALGEMVDIGGYVGEVVNVVHQSLKVRSPEGVTKSFNAAGLRKLYGPRILPEPMEMRSATPVPEPKPEEPAPAAPLAPRRDIITEPDFSKPVRKISEYVRLPDYPKCTFGEHVEVGGYVGVVVEIVNRSLKVRSKAETTRSYNAEALRKLYAP